MCSVAVWGAGVEIPCPGTRNKHDRTESTTGQWGRAVRYGIESLYRPRLGPDFEPDPIDVCTKLSNATSRPPRKTPRDGRPQRAFISIRLSGYPGRSSPKYTTRASRRSNPTSFLVVPNTYSTPLTPSLPHESVFGIGKLRRERAIANVEPPSADGPADSPSIRNANATSGGNGGDGDDLPLSTLGRHPLGP